MPSSGLRAIPDHPDILRPEFVVSSGKLHRARSAVLVNAVTKAVDHRQAVPVVRSRRLGLSFEIEDLVLPAQATSRDPIPIHKRSSPRIKLAEQFGVRYLDWMLEFAATH